MCKSYLFFFLKKKLFIFYWGIFSTGSDGKEYAFYAGDHGQRSLVGYSPWGCKESDN